MLTTFAGRQQVAETLQARRQRREVALSRWHLRVWTRCAKGSASFKERVKFYRQDSEANIAIGTL